MATILSVVTPIFNGERFVERCYASLKAQTFADWEWVVVDDGSTDGTAKALGGIHDCRLRIVRLPHNEGRGSARARALNEARGDWMVVWDVDDLNYPDRLARVNSARLEGYDFCCSYAVVVDNALRMKGVRGFEPAFRVLPRYFVHPTLACRTDLARDIGYDPALRAGEDLTLMLTLARRYRGQFIDEALMIYQEDREVNLDKAIASNESQRARQEPVVLCCDGHALANEAVAAKGHAVVSFRLPAYRSIAELWANHSGLVAVIGSYRIPEGVAAGISFRHRSIMTNVYITGLELR